LFSSNQLIILILILSLAFSETSTFAAWTKSLVFLLKAARVSSVFCSIEIVPLHTLRDCLSLGFDCKDKLLTANTFFLRYNRQNQQKNRKNENIRILIYFLWSECCLSQFFLSYWLQSNYSRIAFSCVNSC